jgi:hypothetical protein
MSTDSDRLAEQRRLQTSGQNDTRPKRTTAVSALGIGVSQGQDARFRS